MNKSHDAISISYQQGSSPGQPYQSRHDAVYTQHQQKRHYPRDMEMEKFRRQVPPTGVRGLSNTLQPGQQKHVTINENASIAYDFNQSNPYQHQQDNETEFNDRANIDDNGSETASQQTKTPVKSSMKPFNDRVVNRSSMEYARTPQPIKNLKAPNPLFGESEGDYKHKIIQDEYKVFVKKTMGKSPERSASKREIRHIEKRREAISKSPTNEPNIYAQKQRYKYSYFNQVNGINSGLDQSFSEAPMEQNRDYYQSVPRLQTNAYANLLNQRDQVGQGTGYILKTDPMQVLIKQEVQKQQYAKELREQMSENQQKKQDQRLKVQQYDLYMEEQIKMFEKFGKSGSGAPPKDLLDVSITQLKHNTSGYQRDDSPQFQNQNQNNNQINIQQLSPDRINFQVNQNQHKSHQAVRHFHPENNNPMFDQYEQQLKARERKKEDWQQALVEQMNEQQRLKHEQKLKKQYEDQLDEERVHRQLRELNNEFVSEGKPKSYFTKRESPPPQIRKRDAPHQVNESFMEHKIMNRDNSKSQISNRNDISYDNQNKSMISQHSNTLLPNVRIDRDFEVDQQLKVFKMEAQQTSYDTTRAMERLNQMQSEIYLKQKQNQLHNAEFYNDMMNQSKIMLTSIKYHQPVESMSGSTKNMFSYLTPMQSRNPNSFQNVQSDFQMMPGSYTKEPKIERPSQQFEMIKLSNPNSSVADELDDLLHRFQYQ